MLAMEVQTPSQEMDKSDVVQNADDSSSLTNDISKRFGNLWTAEAREDLFRRRKAGEGWETIGRDFPTRSRHAMQQQYSVSPVKSYAIPSHVAHFH